MENSDRYKNVRNGEKWHACHPQLFSLVNLTQFVCRHNYTEIDIQKRHALYNLQFYVYVMSLWEALKIFMKERIKI